MSRIEESVIEQLKQETKEEQIERIRKQYEQETPPISKGAITGGNEIARGGFSKSHFPLEFIQNADDEGADKITFHIDENEIRIADNGDGFDLHGIVAVCQQGRSPKNPEDKIGFMGIGFKSIFEICERVEVYSNGYQFYFEPSDESEGIPGNLVPRHLNNDETPSDDYETVVIGNIRDDVDLLGDEEPLSPTNLSPTIFLFLNELEEIRIKGQRNGNEIDRTLTRKKSVEQEIVDDFDNIRQQFIDSDGFSGHPDGEIPDEDCVNIRTIKEETETNWIIFRDFWDIGDIARPAFRDDVEVTDVFAAFRLDAEGQILEIPEGGSVRISPVHSYLPLKQLETIDIDFLIHADFDLTPNREGIRSNSEWNNQIAEEVRTCLETVLQVVAKHDNWWRKIHLLVPETESGTNDIIDGILNTFAENIRETAVARDYSSQAPGEFFRPDAMTKVSDDVRKLFTPTEVEQIIDERPIHPEQHELLDRLGQGTEEEVTDLLREDAVTDVLEARADDINWFGDLYAALASEREGSPTSKKTRRTLSNEILLTRSGSIVAGREGWRRREEWIPYLSPGSDFDTDLNWALETVDLVPSKVLDRLYDSEENEDDENRRVRAFFEDAGAETATAATIVSQSLSEEDIDDLDRSRCKEIIDIYCGADKETFEEDIIVWLNHIAWDAKRSYALRAFVENCQDELTYTDCVEWVSNRWRSLTSQEKDATVEFCKQAYDDGVTEDDIYSFLRLKNQKGQWTAIGDLLLPVNDVASHDEFEGQPTVYQDAINDVGLSFVDPAYYEQEEETDETWIDFLQHIGVNDDERLDKLAGRIGELYVQTIIDDTVTKRSDIEGGADFVSADGTKLIEVKSTRSFRKSQVRIGGQQLTEFDDCREDGSQEFIVYPVSNALKDPEIKDGPFTAQTLWNSRDEITFDI